MKVLVCGGREFTDAAFMADTLTEWMPHKHRDIIIHGGARGADRLAGAWGRANGVPVAAVPAMWELGSRAGPMRNGWMLRLEPDMVIAFPGGNGTADMVRQSNDAGVRVIVELKQEDYEKWRAAQPPTEVPDQS